MERHQLRFKSLIGPFRELTWNHVETKDCVKIARKVGLLEDQWAVDNTKEIMNGFGTAMVQKAIGYVGYRADDSGEGLPSVEVSSTSNECSYFSTKDLLHLDLKS